MCISSWDMGPLPYSCQRPTRPRIVVELFVRHQEGVVVRIEVLPVIPSPSRVRSP